MNNLDQDYSVGWEKREKPESLVSAVAAAGLIVIAGFLLILLVILISK